MTGPNSPALDSGAIGRLEDALAPFVRCGERYCDSFADGNRECPDCCARVIVVAALVSKHVTAALAEVESRIEAWIRHGEEVPADVTTYERWIVHEELRAIVRDYREGVGR